MIPHIIHYFKEPFYNTWEIELPFRLQKGDYICEELLGKVEFSRGQETDEWIAFCIEQGMFVVDYIFIDHNTNVVAWLCTEKATNKKGK
jgi:hypothetical protein